jgi:hypothetical protein
MGDPFSVAGSVVGIISLGIQISENLCTHYNSVKDVTKATRQITDRLKKLNNIFVSLKDAIELRNHRY